MSETLLLYIGIILCIVCNFAAVLYELRSIKKVLEEIKNQGRDQ